MPIQRNALKNRFRGKGNKGLKPAHDAIEKDEVFSVDFFGVVLWPLIKVAQRLKFEFRGLPQSDRKVAPKATF